MNNLLQKGIIRYSLINCYLSKKEEVYDIDDLKDVEMLLKGKVRNTGDTRRYYIRLTFKNNRVLFGKCMTFRKVLDKVKLLI